MTIVSRVERCRCQCHAMADDTAWKYGVDSRDHVACVLACESCRKNHERVLYDDDPPSVSLADTSTAWVDSQPDGDKGEGHE